MSSEGIDPDLDPHLEANAGEQADPAQNDPSAFFASFNFFDPGQQGPSGTAGQPPHEPNPSQQSPPPPPDIKPLEKCGLSGDPVSQPKPNFDKLGAPGPDGPTIGPPSDNLVDYVSPEGRVAEMAREQDLRAGLFFGAVTYELTGNPDLAEAVNGLVEGAHGVATGQNGM